MNNLLDKAQVLLEENKLEDALAIYNDITNLFPKEKDGWYNKIHLMKVLDKGNNDEFLNCYQKIIKLSPKDERMWYEMGQVYIKLNKDKDALYAFNKIISINKKKDFPVKLAHEQWYQVGLFYEKNGEFVIAENIYNSGHKALYAFLSKESHPPYLNLTRKGEILSAFDRIYEAIDCYDKSIEQNSSDFHVLGLKMIALGNLGKYDEALELYNTDIRSLKTKFDIYYYYNIKHLFEQQENYKKSLSINSKILERDPDNPLIWIERSAYLRALGRYDESIECCENAIRIDNMNFKAWFEKGKTFEYMYKYHEALKCYNTALELASSTFNYKHSGDILQQKGILLSKMERHQESIEYFDRSLDLFRSKLSLIHKAFSLEMLNCFEEAVDLYNEVRIFSIVFGRISFPNADDYVPELPPP